MWAIPIIIFTNSFFNNSNSSKYPPILFILNLSLENFVNETQKAIEKKDGKLARDIWSKVTEYSVQANEYGDEELSEAIKSLAITYVKLIEYCDNGDLNNLTMFNEEFEKALENIKSISNF